MKSSLASAKGAVLQRLRYGTNLEYLVRLANDHENWSADQWRYYQEQQLNELLYIAYNHVPYYRDQWAKRRAKGDRSSWEELKNWPILDKQVVRGNPIRFVREGISRGTLYMDHTSGTSGTPLTIYQSKETIRAWYALFEARWRRWYGVSLADRWAIFGGQLVAHQSRREPPFWVWNAGMRQLYCSSYHISLKSAAEYMRALADHKIVYIIGYASALYSLARYGLELGLTPPRLKLVLNNAEPLYEHQRETIAEFFCCEVRDSYGMSEMLCAASECELGHAHLWPEVGIQEISPELGLISTGLLNLDMPLIRYTVGDNITFATEKNCACGRSMPIIDSIEGRVDDIVLTTDGKRIGRLDPIFKADLKIKEAQIIQEKLERFLIKVVPAPGYSSSDADFISAGLKERVGIDVQVTIELVDSIPRTKAGKFKAVISKVNVQ